MPSNFLFVIFILALLVAKLEGNVEGQFPWAKKLPTSRFKNWFTDLVMDGKEITGYHIWLFSSLFLVFHLHFLWGYSWGLGAEFLTLAYFVAFMVVEDFLSIMLNPYFGLKKFSKQWVTWHINWLGPVPLSYVQGGVLAVVLFVVSRLVS